MLINVLRESPRSEAVARLLAKSDDVAAQLYPGEFRRRLDPDTLDAPDIHLLVARHEGIALGCCAVFALPSYCELKRMIVDEAARRRGVAKALLRAAVETARRLEVEALKLEVGIRNTEAERMYRAFGFADCPPFGSYRASPISTFLELRVAP